MYLLITKGTKLTTPINNKTIVLQEDIKIPVETRTVFETDLEEFNIHGSCYSLDMLKNEVLIKLAYDYEDYGLANEKYFLTEDGREYKRKISNLFKEVED